MTDRRIRIFEVGPRDGLQNERSSIATSEKAQLVDMLSDCGLEKIEVTSFVSPKWVPQMADAAELMARINRMPGVCYSVLVPNPRGYEAARRAMADEVAVFASASEGFSQRNTNCSIAEGLDRFRPVLAAAASDGVPVRGYVSCVIDCPYDGATPPESVARVARMLSDMGCYEISLGDTVGTGRPETVGTMLDAVLDCVSADKLAGHYHDTHGSALANIEVSLGRGLRVFDTAVGGLGGCPYAPGSSGNVATEAVVSMLHNAGFETGVDGDKLTTAGRFATGLQKQVL